MIRLFALCAIALLGLYCGKADAAIAKSSRSIITSLIFYEAYESGDVTFTFPNGVTNIPGCSGFWIRATDGGFKTILTAVLTAYQSGASIIVDADTDQIWPGSSARYCLVFDVRY